MAKKVSESLTAGQGFSMVGTVDKIKRTYTCLERTIAPINNGDVSLQNVVAFNHATSKKVVFAFTQLLGTANLV